MTLRRLLLAPFALCLMHCGYPDFEFGPGEPGATSSTGSVGGASTTATTTATGGMGGDATTTTTTTSGAGGAGGAGGSGATTTTTTTTTSTTTTSTTGGPPQVVCQDGTVTCNPNLVCCFHDTQASCDRCAQPGQCTSGAPASCFIGEYQEFHCDGNEDCTGSEVCCFNDANPSSACAATCDPAANEYFFCDMGMCPASQGCFQLNGHAGYDFCQ